MILRRMSFLTEVSHLPSLGLALGVDSFMEPCGRVRNDTVYCVIHVFMANTVYCPSSTIHWNLSLIALYWIEVLLERINELSCLSHVVWGFKAQFIALHWVSVVYLHSSAIMTKCAHAGLGANKSWRAVRFIERQESEQTWQHDLSPYMDCQSYKNEEKQSMFILSKY